MKKRQKRLRKRNPYAQILSMRKYRQRREVNKRTYKRVKAKQEALRIDG